MTDEAAVEDSDAPAGSSRRDAVARFARPLCIYAVSRCITLVAFVVGATVASYFGDDLIAKRPWPPAPTGSLTMQALAGWDGAWYVQIAESGYGPAESLTSVQAFFPLYPFTIRLVSGLTGLGVVPVAVALAAAFGAIAALLLWELSRVLGGRPFADRTVVLFSFFPGSFVLSMAYSEGMMLAASIACLLSLHRRWWVAAGIFAAVATATRPNAAVLVACCSWAAAQAIRSRREWMALVAPALSGVGILAYFVFLARRTGDALAWFHVQDRIWNDGFAPVTIVERAGRTVSHLTGDSVQVLNDIVPTVGILFAAVAVAYLVRWRPPAILAIYAGGILLLALASSNLGLRPRFLLTAFPLLQALAWRLRDDALAVTAAASSVLLGCLIVLTVLTTTATP